MPRKTSTSTGTAPAKVISPVAQELIKTVETAKAQIKSAKALTKVIDCVGKLDAWGLDRLSNAIIIRREELAPKA